MAWCVCMKPETSMSKLAAKRYTDRTVQSRHKNSLQVGKLLLRALASGQWDINAFGISFKASASFLMQHNPLALRVPYMRVFGHSSHIVLVSTLERRCSRQDFRPWSV
eukprot:scaffold115269_cov19-Prasinocladus_malaysianus.AAC.1